MFDSIESLLAYLSNNKITSIDRFLSDKRNLSMMCVYLVRTDKSFRRIVRQVIPILTIEMMLYNMLDPNMVQDKLSRYMGTEDTSELKKHALQYISYKYSIDGLNELIEEKGWHNEIKGLSGISVKLSSVYEYNKLLSYIQGTRSCTFKGLSVVKDDCSWYVFFY